MRTSRRKTPPPAAPGTASAGTGPPSRPVGGGQQCHAAARRGHQRRHVLRRGDLVHRQHLGGSSPAAGSSAPTPWDTPPSHRCGGPRPAGGPRRTAPRSPPARRPPPPAGEAPPPRRRRPAPDPAGGWSCPAPEGPGSGRSPAARSLTATAAPPPPPRELPRHPHRSGGQLPDGPHCPVLQGHRAAQPHPVSPLDGQVPPAELVQHGVDRGPGGQLQQLLQLLLGHGGPGQCPLPSGSTAAIGSPTRSRSSSIWLRRSSGRDITPPAGAGAGPAPPAPRRILSASSACPPPFDSSYEDRPPPMPPFLCDIFRTSLLTSLQGCDIFHSQHVRNISHLRKEPLYAAPVQLSVPCSHSPPWPP